MICQQCGGETGSINTRRLYCGPCKSLRNAAAKHSSAMKIKFGITDSEYAVLLKRQDGKCALCERAPYANRRLAVDHDHKTGKVRGLLCDYCNRQRLGRSREDPEMHRRIADYLDNGPGLVAKALGRVVVAPPNIRKRKTKRRVSK